MIRAKIESTPAQIFPSSIPTRTEEARKIEVTVSLGWRPSLSRFARQFLDQIIWVPAARLLLLAAAAILLVVHWQRHTLAHERLEGLLSHAGRASLSYLGRLDICVTGALIALTLVAAAILIGAGRARTVPGRSGRWQPRIIRWLAAHVPTSVRTVVVAVALISLFVMGELFTAQIAEFARFARETASSLAAHVDNRAFGLTFALTIALLATSLVQLHRRKLDPIWVYLLPPEAPFPVLELPHSERSKHIFVIRIVGPDLDKDLRQYTALRSPISISLEDPPDTSDDTHVGAAMKTLRNTTKRQRQAAENFWPLVRVALDRTLYQPRDDISELERERKRQHPWFFMYIMHVPQIAGFLALAASMLLVERTHVASEWRSLLGALAIVWGGLSIYLHRKQYGHLYSWAQRWAAHPFAGNPVFYYRRDQPPSRRWEELTAEDFTVRIQEFGLDNGKLLDGLIAFLILGFLALLDAIKGH